jgi:hypothetical protein
MSFNMLCTCDENGSPDGWYTWNTNIQNEWALILIWSTYCCSALAFWFNIELRTLLIFWCPFLCCIFHFLFFSFLIILVVSFRTTEKFGTLWMPKFQKPLLSIYVKSLTTLFHLLFDLQNKAKQNNEAQYRKHHFVSLFSHNILNIFI